MEVVAFERQQKGTGSSRRMRRAGRTPGIVYGAGIAPQQIEFDHNAIWHALKKEAFHSSILDLTVLDEHLDTGKAAAAQQVLLREVQYHPYKPVILHIDLQRVDAKKKLHTKVPLHYLNQESSKAVKVGGAVLTQVMNDIEITCLPGNLPEFIEVDLAEIEAGQSLHAKNINLPKGVELASHLEQDNPVIVSAILPGAAAEESETAATQSEGDEAAAAS